MRKGNGFQVEQSLVSKKISNPGGVISKEENRSGRPVPGSSSFVRLNRVDPSTAKVKKLLSGDYLTFYMGNLSYRATDVTLKTAIENRFPITVDQAVVAYSSDGRSRGCAFVTVRWKESQFVFRSKLAESSTKVLSQLDGQAVVRSTCLRGAGLQSTTWWLICLRRRSTSAHTRMAYWSSSTLSPNPPLFARFPSHSGGALRQAWRVKLLLVSVGCRFVLKRRHDP